MSSYLLESSVPISEGNYLFVDIVYGNDTIARPNLRSKPFKTIGAAVTLCKKLGSMYIIIVAPGNYSESLNLLANATYEFEAGVIIQNVSSTPLFNDNEPSFSAGVIASIQGILIFNF